MSAADAATVEIDLPQLDACPVEASALLDSVRLYLPEDQVERVRLAYLVGAAAHHGQNRRSGEPYITHPLAVAGILAELRLDAETLCAAILHDTLEDTKLGRGVLVAAFGETVAELVDGVTKLEQIEFKDRQEAAAESLRKMLLAMARDLRVILIKLADRLHNMRTIGAMAPASRRRIARETLEIYAPIAQRLGMNRIKSELQDLGFQALHPFRHAVIRKRIQSQPVLRREAMATIEAALAQKLAKEKIPNRLVGRVKSPYSVYTKMRVENKSFDEVMDVFGVRIVVERVLNCYFVLGLAHALFKPLDGRFRDFIAIPKANGYQSLHTVLFSPFNSPIEVQIRTEDMDQLAERGIAAHWMYKSGDRSKSSAEVRANDWLAGLLESQEVTGSPTEFLENVRVDLFPDEVYLFTPKGDILSLPRNATALDFAYAVHTDLGDHAVAARVDKQLVPLRTRLQSGQLIEIIRAPSATPSPAWLEFVVSSKARTAIRHFLKRLQHEDAVGLGHRMLDRALEAVESSLDRVPAERLEHYLAEARLPRLEELLSDIALGNRMPQQVAHALTRRDDAELLPAASLSPSVEKISITGAERGVLTFANCCHPLPGDDIMGYLSAGKGIVVHRLECPNVNEYRKSPERWVQIEWARDVHGDYAAGLRVEAENRPGVLAKVAASIADAGANIDNVEYRERDLRMAVMHFGIEVTSRKHLADVIRRIRRLAVAHGVRRL